MADLLYIILAFGLLVATTLLTRRIIGPGPGHDGEAGS
jgi:hypothetical protein